MSDHIVMAAAAFRASNSTGSLIIARQPASRSARAAKVKASQPASRPPVAACPSLLVAARAADASKAKPAPFSASRLCFGFALKVAARPQRTRRRAAIGSRSIARCSSLSPAAAAAAAQNSRRRERKPVFSPSERTGWRAQPTNETASLFPTRRCCCSGAHLWQWTGRAAG